MCKTLIFIKKYFRRLAHLVESDYKAVYPSGLDSGPARGSLLHVFSLSSHFLSPIWNKGKKAEKYIQRKNKN